VSKERGVIDIGFPDARQGVAGDDQEVKWGLGGYVVKCHAAFILIDDRSGDFVIVNFFKQGFVRHGGMLSER
jgi:hypothetical protein